VKKILKKLSNQTVTGTRNELARAHFIITLLSIIAIILLVLGVDERVVFDATLSGIAGGLLIIVALISFSVSLTLSSKKK
jgi:hypothetical protein